MIKTVAVNVKLTCRGCRGEFERVLNLPVGVDPPKEFTCPACVGDQSMVDGQDLDHVVRDTKLARMVLRKRRPELLHARGEEWLARWREKNRDWHKLYRVLYRAGFNFQDDPPFSLAEWYAKVEREYHWLCANCSAPLTPDTVVCSWQVPMSDGGTICLENCVPLCRRCSNTRAANQRWEKEK